MPGHVVAQGYQVQGHGCTLDLFLSLRCKVPAAAALTREEGKECRAKRKGRLLPRRLPGNPASDCFSHLLARAVACDTLSCREIWEM